MLKEMAMVATECVKNPQHQSIWSPELGRYICPKSERARHLKHAANTAPKKGRSRTKLPSISSQFKMVFLAAASGTLLFAIICVVLTLVAGKEVPPLTEKVILGLFDLAKIGFGAIVGMLGGFVFREKGEQSRSAGA